MNDDVQTALATVGRRLHDAGVTFLLGGSGLLCALGLTEEVGDLDLQIDEADEAGVVAAAGPWLVEMTREGTALWASPWLARLRVDGVDVDAIGGMAFHHADGVARLPMRAGGTVDVDGVAIAYADPALWWAVYRAYKPDKAACLERVVDDAARARVCAELALPASW